MKKIQLSGHRYKNKPIKGYALIDDEYFEKIKQYKWSYSEGYATYKRIKMHRLIMNCPKGFQVDHINHNGIDNRKENLRIVTSQQNKMNQLKTKSTSIYKGVSWNTERQKWVAQIGFNKKTFNLGKFDNQRHAALVRDIWAKELFGEYALLNFGKPSF